MDQFTSKCRCCNTIEIDSDHRILTATVKFNFRTTKKTSSISMYNHKAITSNDVVRNKFQLELSNRFEDLQINEDDTVQTAYDKLELGLNEAASNTLPRKEKNTNKPWVSTQNVDLIKQRRAARKKYQNHRNPEN